MSEVDRVSVDGTIHGDGQSRSRSRIEGQERDGEQEGKEQQNSKKPADSAFKQQRLPAWQPILTAGTVLPTFFVIGIAFIPIGIGMLWFSDNVREIKKDYTECVNAEGLKCSDLVKNTTDVCLCDSEQLNFTLAEDWEGEVFVYYALTNFYQNHRRYVKSRDDGQLLGNIDKTPSSDCEPFDKDEEGKTYFPCGAIANSLFSDDIELKYMDESNNEIEVPLNRYGIAWESDKNYKFKNPTGEEGQSLQQIIENAGVVKPRDWHQELWELDPINETNNGLQNEDLMVWMRTAALPNFRKLYRKIDHTAAPFDKGLKKGLYKLKITYRFRVVEFSGTKSVVVSTTSLLGGKNPFLGIAYISVGSICLLMGVVFLFIHLKFGKQTSEMMNISTRTPYN